MTNRRSYGLDCIGYGEENCTKPCPKKALVYTMGAKRCKSCAARQRKIDYPESSRYQLAGARGNSPVYTMWELSPTGIKHLERVGRTGDAG